VSHPNTWAALTYAGLDKAADKLGVVDATDGVTKTLILNELIKRTLATDDISVLTTIGIGTTVPASDYLPIWEAASTSIKRLLLKDLMDRTLASTDVASWMTAFTGLSEVADTDAFFAFDTSANVIKRIVAVDLLRYIRITNTHHTGNFSLATSDAFGRHTNVGTAATITGTLAAMPVGWRMRFLRHADFEVRIDPDATQTIAAGGAGKYLAITGYGELELEVISTNVIAVTGGNAPWSLEV